MSDNEVVFIPLRSYDEAIILESDTLPENVQELIELLRYEEVKLDVWLQIAVCYYKRQKIDQFLKILNTGATQKFGDNFDKIAILDSIAAYYIELAKNTKDKSLKHKYYEEANNYFSKADKINIREEITWVGKGVLNLQKEELYDRAFRDFETVLSTNDTIIPAILGKAAIFFQRGSYREALNQYKKALENNPYCPPCVRNGIAICYYQLGKIELARKWFERVLEMEPDNIDAVVSVAILEMSSGTAGCIKRAYQIISRVYQVKPTHSRVLNLLANYYFHRNDFNSARVLASRALDYSSVPKIQAESNYIIGRNYQTQNDYEHAYEFYQKAVELWPNYPLALFGFAQMCIYKEQPLKAQKLLEQVLEIYPHNVETLKILASLIANSNEELSKQYLRKVLEKHPNDWTTWVELARICEKSDVKSSLLAYEKAANILGLIDKSTNESSNGVDSSTSRPNDVNVGLELWNNIGVLRFKVEDYKGAEIAFLKSIDCSHASLLSFLPINITSTYNLARVYEEMNRLKESEALYLGILKEHPNYLDCYLRLANISKETGHFADAIGWINFSYMINMNNIDSWSMMGSLHLQKLEWQPAQHKFEQILRNLDKLDSYSLLALGNIYYNAKFDNKQPKEKTDRYFQLSMDFYWKVLQLQPNNIYAANGLGIVMAEKRKLAEAKDFFMKVRESTSNFPDVWINLAHVFVLQGQYSNAISIYSKCLSKFYFGQNGNVLLYLSYSYYLNRDFLNAKKTLLKAIHLFPTNLNSWYNLAITLKDKASLIVALSNPSYDDVLAASRDINDAKELLLIMNERAKDVRIKRNYSSNHCVYLSKKLDTMKERCESLLESVKKRHQELEIQQKEQKELAEKLREKTLREIESRKEREIERKRKLAEIAKENEKLLESLQQQWITETNENTRKKRKTQDSPEPASESENEDYGQNEEEDNNNQFDNERRNREKNINEYGSNEITDIESMRKRNASHYEAIISGTKKQGKMEDEEEDDGDDVGFDVELIKEAMEIPENTRWSTLKEYLTTKGINPGLLKRRRKAILKKAREFKKKKE